MSVIETLMLVAASFAASLFFVRSCYWRSRAGILHEDVRSLNAVIRICTETETNLLGHVYDLRHQVESLTRDLEACRSDDQDWLEEQRED